MLTRSKLLIWLTTNIHTSRLLKKKNPYSFFQCDHCIQMETSLFFQTPKVSAKIRTHHRRTSSQCKIIIKDNDEGILKSEFPTQLICLLENKSSNWDIRFKSGLLGNRESVTGLKSEVISSAKSEYVLVHNDSIAYHHLYMYFANRCSTIRDLSKVTKHLFR